MRIIFLKKQNNFFSQSFSINVIVALFGIGLKTQKMVLDASLLYSRHYKAGIKSKVEQSRERNSSLPCASV